MTQQPKKNVSKIIADIKYPGLEEKVRGNYLLSLVSKSDPRFTAHKQPSNFKKLLILPSILLIFIVAYSLNLFDFKVKVSQSAELIYQEAMKLKTSASQLKTEETIQSIKNIDDEIKNIETQSEEHGLLQASYLIGQMLPSIKQFPSLIKNASVLSGKILETVEIVNYLKTNALRLTMTNGGGDLIQSLELLKEDIATIKNLNTDIKNQSLEMQNLDQKFSSFSDILSENYIPLDSELFKFYDLLDSFLTIIKSSNQNILVLFQNPSEMRPAGGFVGSFGYITIDQGNVKNINVDDIYNADRQLEIKSIPPKEMQSITKDWGARDANWFFDFPTSAQKVKGFLEKSKLFSDNGIIFQGVISINTNILGTILKIVGPIDLPEYDLTIDSENYLAQIQYEVEAGRDKKPKQNPKKILSVIAPIIMEKLNNLTEQQKEELTDRMATHIKQKDIMAYAPYEKLENALIKLNVAGEVLTLPEDFNGDYLAVVDANIASGKTDIFIKQNVVLESDLLNSGKLTSKLTITRTHSGQDEKYWWYRTTNKNYMKILIPKSSKLIQIRGNDSVSEKKTTFNYEKNNYEYDNDLKLVESSMKSINGSSVWIGQESGKSFFGAWLSTPAGESKTMELVYERDSVMNIEDGKKYKFIFEKQSGVNNSLDYKINAPLGYIWEESNNQNFEFKTDVLNSRETIELTLKKI